VNIYHKRKHHGIGMSPEQKYRLGIFGDEDTPGRGALPSIIENEEEIRIALLPTIYRSVQKNGITIDGITYYSDVLRIWIGKKDKDGKPLKFKVKRDPMNIQTLYFYDPEVKAYFEIYYRKLSAPKMTLWDLLAAKRYLKEKHISPNEDDLFDAYEALANIQKSSEAKMQKQKIGKSKAPKMTDTPTKMQQMSKPSQKKVEEAIEEDLFSNIKIYDMFEHPNKDDE
jgi:putative transposase